MHIVLKCQYFKFNNLTLRKYLVIISKEIKNIYIHKNVHHNVIITAKNNQLNEQEQIEELGSFV